MMREVKLVDIRAQYDEIRDELWREWEKAFDSMQLVLGPNMTAFEKEFAAYCGVEGAAAVDSGTSALLLALRSMGIGEGDEVIVPSWTFFATPESVLLAGAHPVMVDIDEATFNISPRKVREFVETTCRLDGDCPVDRKSGKKLKAIIPVHIFGLPAAMDELMAIAEEYHLLVLEDCAQAHGAEYKGRKVGSIGDCAAFSFYFSKNLSALGEAGIILSRHPGYIEAIQKLRVHGQTDRYSHSLIGYNARMDELQAVVLRLKLKKLDEWNRRTKTGGPDVRRAVGGSAADPAGARRRDRNRSITCTSSAARAGRTGRVPEATADRCGHPLSSPLPSAAGPVVPRVSCRVPAGHRTNGQGGPDASHAPPSDR